MSPLRTGKILGLAEIVTALRSGAVSWTNEMIVQILLEAEPLVRPYLPILRYGCSLVESMGYWKIRFTDHDKRRFAHGPNGCSWVEQRAHWTDRKPRTVDHRFKRSCQAARSISYLGMIEAGGWLAVRMYQPAIMLRRLAKLEAAGDLPTVKVRAWGAGDLADAVSASGIELSHWVVSDMQHWLASTDRELTKELEGMRLSLLQLSVAATLMGAVQDGSRRNRFDLPHGPV